MRKILTAVIAAAGIAAASAATTQPSFPGGKEALDNYIATNRVYPETAKNNGIEGVVNVGFTVKADGTIGSIKIIRMVDPDLEQESVRLVKGMPKWNPATDNGNPVESTTQIAVPFILE